MKQSVKESSPNFYHLLPFSLSVFLGAFLLFQVQPIISKYILPWFGGSFSVWITAVLFFEILLLCGYLYAYLLTKFSVRIQIFLHAFILSVISIAVLSLFFLWDSPITPPLSQLPGNNFPPVVQIIAVLMTSVGLPYFILSTTSSLLQRWYSNIYKKESPYRLYALSNAGSLLGILSYPFLIELFLPIRLQGVLWALGFIGYALLLFFIMRLTARKGSIEAKESEAVKSETKKEKKYTLAMWIILPLLSSVMLLATTSKITQAVAPVPFLWLVPLALYLLSFILCFDSDKWYWRWFYPYAFIASAIGAILITVDLYSVGVNFSIYSAFLFCTFMLLHGELYSLKPDPQRLNLYYFFIALGGAIGGVVVGVIAPLIFTDFWEFYIGIFLVMVLAIAIITSHKTFLIRRFVPNSKLAKLPQFVFFLILSTILVSGVIYFFDQYGVEKDQIKQIRNFYGTISIQHVDDEYGEYLALYNGEINHGSQYLAEDLRAIPTQYYGEKSGVGLALQHHQKRENQSLNVGIIGLGVGTLATYGEEGDTMRFYEINPAVVDIAYEDFTYLDDSKADVDVVLGDGRLSMERELAEGRQEAYDILVIDAFTDDAIPVHLLTKEAFKTYLDLLEPESGILAVHISNRYLDLLPVIHKQAENYDLSYAVIESSDDDYEVSSATWVLLAKNPYALSDPEIQAEKVAEDTNARVVDTWTDDYSNLFQVLDI